MNSRVQQVLREARAMVGTVRPQTPCAPAPPSRLASLPIQSSSAANGGASSSSTSNHNNNNSITNNGNAPSSSSLFPSAVGGVGRGDRLASPPGTPPPEMEMLIATDRAAKGLVARATTVGQQWAKALLSIDARVRHRAAANIFRHCEDELLDMALSAVARGGSGINISLLKSEGALAALLVIARNPHIHSPNTNTNPISPTTANAAATASSFSSATTATSQQQQQHARLTRVSMILAAAAETEGLKSYLVTNGALQTIAELLPKMIFVPSFLSSFSSTVAAGGVPSRSGSAAPAEQRSTSPPPPSAATASSSSAASSAVPIPIAEQPLTAILNFLTALRALCTEFPHHALKVGLVDPLLRLLSLASSYCLAFASNLLKEKESGGESGDNNVTADCDGVNDNNNAQRLRPSSGAFVSRFAFRPSGAVSTIGGSEAGQAVFEQSAQIVSIAVRIFCQLSFDDECLNDFRLRRDNMLEPLLVYLSFVEPLQDPLLCSRLMLLISRIIDSQEEVCADVVEYHWETVVGKAFECIQKRQQIAQVVSEAMSGALCSSRGGSRGSQRPLTADKNKRPSTSGFSSVGRLANLDEGGAAAVEAAMSASLAASSGASSSMFFAAGESSSSPTAPTRSPATATTAASATAQAHSFIETITSDAVIAALALLSNVTLVEQGGYTLATSLPHMECLIALINCSSELSEEAETKLVASSRVSSASSATTKTAPESDEQQELLLREQRKQIAKQKKEARTTTIRYALIVLSNLSYYLPSMPLNDDGDGDGDEGRSDRYDKESGLDNEEEEGGGALVAKYGSTKRAKDNNNDDDLVGSDDDKGLINLTSSTRATIVTTLALSVCGFLFEGDSEATLEATRILGNLSRTLEGRIWMEENGADEALVLFLGHEDLRLVYNCLGVLLNLTADTDADPSICRNSEALSLLLQHTQRIVRATNVPWEIKEVVQMLLRNVQEIENRNGMSGSIAGAAAAFGGESVGEIEGVDEPYPQHSTTYFTDDENVYAMSRGASAEVADTSDLGATNAELEALAEGGAE